VAVTTYVDDTASAVNVIVAAPTPSLTAVGVPIAAPKTSGAEAGETVEVVLFPLGVTMKVYDVPAARPEMLQCCVPAATGVPVTLQVCPLKAVPISAAATYEYATPSEVNVIVAVPAPSCTAVGADNAAAPAIAAVPRTIIARTTATAAVLFTRLNGLNLDVASGPVTE
jgi:hypothetical protein